MNILRTLQRITTATKRCSRKQKLLKCRIATNLSKALENTDKEAYFLVNLQVLSPYTCRKKEIYYSYLLVGCLHFKSASFKEYIKETKQQL